MTDSLEKGFTDRVIGQVVDLLFDGGTVDGTSVLDGFRLTLGSSEDDVGELKVWVLRKARKVVGAGSLYETGGRYAVHEAALVKAYRGRRLYPRILTRLRYLLGAPITSSSEYSPGAEKAWKRAGATLQGDRYVLNPRRKRR